MKIEEIGSLDRFLFTDLFLRSEAPLLAARFRKAAINGARVSMLHAVDDDWLMPG